MKKIGLLLIVLAISVSALAELRIWADQNGNTLEAELVGTSGNNIVLKKEDGTQITLSPMLLSDEDKAYLKGKVPEDLLDASQSALDRPKPPRLDISISKKTDTKKNVNFVDRDITLILKIRKKSLKPYTPKMTAEIFTVGMHKEDEYYVMLDRTKVEFDFANSDEVELQGTTAHISYSQDYDVGIEYEGNVVVIRDDEGKVFDVVGSNNTFKRSHADFAKFKRDDVFSESFKKKGTRASLNIYTNTKKNHYL